jgi:hypothetical protein
VPHGGSPGRLVDEVVVAHAAEDTPHCGDAREACP